MTAATLQGPGRSPGPTVLALVTDAFGGRGGIAQYNRDLMSAWAATARIVALPRGGSATGSPSGANLRQLAPSPGRLAYAVRALWRARRDRPDVVFCGHLFMAPLALLAARASGARFVLQLHGIDAWDDPGRWRRRAAERADLVLSVSRFTRAAMLRWSDLPPERLRVLPNTVDPRFTPADRAAARALFALTDETVLLSVGRLDARERYKGQDRIIGVLPDLLKHHPRLLYCIAGDGDDRPRLEALARERGVSGAVRFMGAVSDADLPDLYRAADLFALPSTGEGFGIVFLEAMACGTPALGLAVAGAPDALADGRLGLACGEDELLDALDGALARQAATPPSDAARRDLGDTVTRLYGHDAFATRARALLQAVLA